MKNSVFFLFFTLASLMGFAQTNNSNQWALMLNNRFSESTSEYYIDPSNKSTLKYKYKQINYNINPSIIKIKPNKNTIEFGLTINKNSNDFLARKNFGHLQNKSTIIDSSINISGAKTKNIKILFFNNFEYNFIKKETSKIFATLGFQYSFEYNNYYSEPYIYNSFLRRSNHLILNTSIIHRGGIYLGKHLLINYFIPVPIFQAGIVRQYISIPLTLIKIQHTTNFLLNNYFPNQLFVNKQLLLSVGYKF